MFKLSVFERVGFIGSRHGISQDLLERCIKRLSPSALVIVGCSGGVAAQVRDLIASDRLVVFNAEDFQGGPQVRKARRNTAMVKYLSHWHGCLVALPGQFCPDGLIPGEVWQSKKGSEVWSTIALAAGLGVPTLIYVSEMRSPWPGMTQLGDRWWLQCAPEPSPAST